MHLRIFITVTFEPAQHVTVEPTTDPTVDPTAKPTVEPTVDPSPTQTVIVFFFFENPGFC